MDIGSTDTPKHLLIGFFAIIVITKLLSYYENKK
tara:strand:+ start:986 stop:1087 length:102 start_codon:yes stop_codon:yes gene_type:complete